VGAAKYPAEAVKRCRVTFQPDAAAGEQLV
jgi:hypothetical protein